jgi:hypothetical protein
MYEPDEYPTNDYPTPASQEPYGVHRDDYNYDPNGVYRQEYDRTDIMVPEPDTTTWWDR